MLAWIFWHTPIRGVSRDDYQSALHAFHDLIRDLQPPGFIDSRVLEYAGVPWLDSAREVYEDWYLLADSAALDELDRTAVGPRAADAHRRIATLTSAAAAGLYRLRAGAPAPVPSACTWLNKPRAVSYETFIGTAGVAGALWSRQMVLGPTPEFCVEGEVGPDLESDYSISQSGGGFRLSLGRLMARALE